jgi:hypothetical protein
MSNNLADSNEDEISPEFLKLLEETVYAAGKYVVPSEDLRPHTLEAARDYSSDHKGAYSFAKFCLAVVAFVSISLPVFGQLASWRERVSSPTSEKMDEIAMKKNIGMDWGLFEAFCELRQSQASRFGQTVNKNARD